MTPLTLVAVASVVGALLFLAAGYLAARSRAAPVADGAAGGAAEVVSLRAQIAASQGQTDVLLRERDAARRQADALAKERDATRSRIEALEQQRMEPPADVEKTKVGAQDAQLQAVLQSMAEVSTSRDQLAKDKATALEQVKSLSASLARQQQELTALRAQAAPPVFAGPSAEQSRKQIEQLQQQLAESRAREQELIKSQTDSAQLKKHVDDQKAALAAAEAKLGHVTELEEERFRLKEALKEAEREVARLKDLEGIQADRQELSVKVQMLQQKAEAADGLRDEQHELRQTLAEAQREVENLKAKSRALEQVDNERHDLMIKTEVMQGRLQEMERLREQSAGLALQANELATARQEIDALKVELGGYRSQVLVQSAPPRPVVKVNLESIGGSLQTVLNRIAQQSTSRGAAIADDLGLVVAGIGEHQDALAASAAMFTELGKRLQSILPISSTELLVAVDTNGLHVSAQPYELESGRLILVTLSSGPGPERKSVEQMLVQNQPRAASPVPGI